MGERRSMDGLSAVAASNEDRRPAVPPADDGERSRRLAELNKLIELMRPAVQADGGDLVLLSADVDSGIVEVELRGSCSSCAISSATLDEGVSRLLTGRLDWVTEVRGRVQEVDDLEASAAMGTGGWVPKFTQE